MTTDSSENGPITMPCMKVSGYIGLLTTSDCILLHAVQ